AAATLEPPGSASAELLERYPQYRDDPPAGQVIALTPERILWWLWEGPMEPAGLGPETPG
ncbi:MAG TPA: TIGR03668 family PPOX class F420-dependent oxidoreductase, partial [Actinomycetota bacterium]|nr:TIGR03668 family PPOX class F420-dependent oxidoreductase [Actinomycetota bacterium]